MFSSGVHRFIDIFLIMNLVTRLTIFHKTDIFQPHFSCWKRMRHAATRTFEEWGARSNEWKMWVCWESGVTQKSFFRIHCWSSQWECSWFLVLAGWRWYGSPESFFLGLFWWLGSMPMVTPKFHCIRMEINNSAGVRPCLLSPAFPWKLLSCSAPWINI